VSAVVVIMAAGSEETVRRAQDPRTDEGTSSESTRPASQKEKVIVDYAAIHFLVL
jgi:hypothetical protein